MRIWHGLVQNDVIKLIEEAKHRLVLVSPYIDLWLAFTTALERAAARGVKIIMIVRGGKDAEKQERKLAPVRHAITALGFVERLHAKIYLHETAAILTSMNLVAGSARDTIEVSALIDKQWSPKEYAQLRRICDKLIDCAAPEKLRTDAARTEDDDADEDGDEGHCIRCAEVIVFSVDRPYCHGCYLSWRRTKKHDFEEKYCHGCGERCDTTFSEPLCEEC